MVVAGVLKGTCPALPMERQWYLRGSVTLYAGGVQMGKVLCCASLWQYGASPPGNAGAFSRGRPARGECTCEATQSGQTQKAPLFRDGHAAAGTPITPGACIPIGMKKSCPVCSPRGAGLAESLMISEST